MNSAISEICFQALRRNILISVSRYLYDFGHLGDMVSSFEARNIERASRSNAKTGLCWASSGLENGDFAWDVLNRRAHGHVSSMLRCHLFFKKPSWAILGSSWACLGTSWGHLGPSRDHFGRPGAILGQSWAVSGSLGHLGRLGSIRGPSGRHFGVRSEHLGMFSVPC